MFKYLLVLIFIGVLASCSSTGKSPISKGLVESTSTDPEYGYTENKPIELGGFLLGTKYEGAHIEYFQSLMGPNGETVKVKRLGSCCAFEDPSMPFGGGLLDRYELSYKGQSKPVIIYVNLYKFNKPVAPQGFILL
ncbi:hypothetical protein [Catenovulum agarivorans]|uniref:hypothetical protein n=1 Tax=Catenovulum agarivorans TaxID=1172192 RepID=UPI00030A77C2|nr:hypothetical protein [Catenovulum agarivorans]